MATEAVDRRFHAAIEQFQPKQRRAIKIDRRTRQHADLVAANRGERNRCFRTILGNGAEFDVSFCNSQFGQRPFGRVAIYQSSEIPKKALWVRARTKCNAAARIGALRCRKPTIVERSEMRLLEDANYLGRRARIYRLVIVHIDPSCSPHWVKVKNRAASGVQPGAGSVRLSVSSRPRAKLAHVFEAIHASRSSGARPASTTSPPSGSMMARTEWKNADWLSPLSVVATIQTAGPSSSIQSSRIRTSKSNSMSSANCGVHVAWIPEIISAMICLSMGHCSVTIMAGARPSAVAVANVNVPVGRREQRRRGPGLHGSEPLRTRPWPCRGPWRSPWEDRRSGGR